jgi:hypothetical protein
MKTWVSSQLAPFQTRNPRNATTEPSEQEAKVKTRKEIIKCKIKTSVNAKEQ